MERAHSRPALHWRTAVLDVLEGCYLSNGPYSVLLDARGEGRSSFDSWALTAGTSGWERGGGFFLYLRDLGTGTIWSAGDRPVGRPPEEYRASGSPGSFTIVRRDLGIESRLDVCVADEPYEVRRLTLINDSPASRRIEVTSYIEVVLDRPAANVAHPAFSRLFVQTESLVEHGALLARRRPRAADDRIPWLGHALAEGGRLEIETDRARFVGRGRTLIRPRALEVPDPLSGTAGNVLDPILSLRRVVELRPGEQMRLHFLLGVGWDREELVDRLDRGTSADRLESVFSIALVRACRTIESLGLHEETASQLQSLAAGLLARRVEGRTATAYPVGIEPVALRERYGVPPDHALVLLDVVSDPDAVLWWRAAVRYWNESGVPATILVTGDIREDGDVVLEGGERCRMRAFLPYEASDLERLKAVADLSVRGKANLMFLFPLYPRRRVFPPATNVGSRTVQPAAFSDEALSHFNGIGGFTADGREYVLRLEPGENGHLRLPPRPWTNILANGRFGTLATEAGLAATWNRNSRLHRLTPWSNDPLLDPLGETLWLRDEKDDSVWSPLPQPSSGSAPCEVRHGFGSTTWRRRTHGLLHETTVFVSREEPVQFLRLRISNESERRRHLSVFSFKRLVLGGSEEISRHVVTTRDGIAGVSLAQNPAAGDFARSTTYSAAVAPAGGTSHFTCDHEVFRFVIERESERRWPVLGGKTGVGLDPCFADQVLFDLDPGESAECSFLFGEERNRDELEATIDHYRIPGAIDAALSEVRGFWDQTLSAVQIETPSSALDLMVNGWLGYQTLSCRMWARTAFYQSGGAFGYRDQLQDAAGLMWLDPRYLRDQLLLHAAHQFVEGDVLHWWHPPLGRGIRTRFADDLLWLPYLTAHYVATTGDGSILDEMRPFLTARALEDGEDEAYLLPETSGESGGLYDHCCRAIDRSLQVGAHGLPLFGTGDWNDGMNRVGREGKGESVWMGFFLVAVLRDFERLCEARADLERIERYRAHRERLVESLNREAWDGEWYLRGFFDDGTPLGSAKSDECRIDGLVQAWAVMSGAAPPERARQALDSVERHLVSEDDRLIRLLTPPFDRMPQDPGYIRGYVPGVRENGGQYTHAALWVVRALAQLGRRDRAARLLEMLSPVSHSSSPEDVARYEVEPYVIAADVYGAPPHVGRGGWTWYTGSSGWMLRVALENVLGLRVVGGDTLIVRPCIPDEWPGFRVTLRLPGDRTTIEVRVRSPEGKAEAVKSARLDGAAAPVEEGAARIPLPRDGRTHVVEIDLG